MVIKWPGFGRLMKDFELSISSSIFAATKKRRAVSHSGLLRNSLQPHRHDEIISHSRNHFKNTKKRHRRQTPGFLQHALYLSSDTSRPHLQLCGGAHPKQLRPCNQQSRSSRGMTTDRSHLRLGSHANETLILLLICVFYYEEKPLF